MKTRDIRTTLDYLAQLIQQDADRLKAEARGESPAQLLAAAEDRAKQAEQRAEVATRDAKIYSSRLSQLGTAYGEQRNRANDAERDAERFKADHLAACRTIADMHEAATGRTGMGPIRGVVEDVADVRDRAENFEGRARAMDQRARHWRSVAEQADATLQRVRDADTLADALTAVGEHDGLPPEAARAAANIAAAAEQPAVVDAERERDHALRLAAAEHSKREAQRVAERATQTLLRVKHASTAGDAWTAIGTHFHMTSTDVGRGARAWRSTAETIAERHTQRAENDVKEIAEQLRTAEERAETASVLGARYMGDAERFQAAWHSARLRASLNAGRHRVARDSRKRWKTHATALTAEITAIQTPTTVSRDHPMHALLDAMTGPAINSAEARERIGQYFDAITRRKG